MTDDKDDRERPGPSREKASRADRLKLALRENLKRRKAQARERGKVMDVSSSDHKTCLDGRLGKRSD